MYVFSLNSACVLRTWQSLSEKNTDLSGLCMLCRSALLNSFQAPGRPSPATFIPHASLRAEPALSVKGTELLNCV